MPYLDAALAFALTMLAVATLVTQIVRLLHHWAGIRVETMQEMLSEYFTKELKPVVDRELNRLKKEIPEDAAATIKESAGKLGIALPFSQEELKKLTEVSADELVERLKRSDMGKALLETLSDKANIVFDELKKNYDLLGIKFTKSYRAKARMWATVIALILAFALNIDSIFIAKTYITNQDARQAVIEQGDALKEGYTTLTDQFEAEKDKTTFTKEEFEEAFADTQKELNNFTSFGFPIGWSYFPHSALQATPSDDFQDRDNPLGRLTWFVGCILTGLLAGLGGPFWYDVVEGISHTTKNLRGQKG